MEIDIAINENANSNKWINLKIEWLNFIEKCKYLSRKNNDSVFLGGLIQHNFLVKANVLNRSLIILKAELYNGLVKDHFLNKIKNINYECLVYNQKKHEINKPKFFLVFPLEKSIESKNYEAYSRTLANEIGLKYFLFEDFQCNSYTHFPSFKLNYYIKHFKGKFYNNKNVKVTYYYEKRSLPKLKIKKSIDTIAIQKKLDEINKFLDIPIPLNWYYLNLEEQRNFIHNKKKDKNVPLKKRDRVNCFEIYNILYKQDEKIPKTESLAINELIDMLPHWRKTKGIKMGKYGVNKGFVRTIFKK